MQFLEADRTEEHGLGKVLRQVAGAVHAAGKVDAVGHPEEVTDLEERAMIVNKYVGKVYNYYDKVRF